MLKQKPKILTSVKRVSLLAILVIVTAGSFVVAFSRQETARAATNSTINFQARLLTVAGNLVPDGDYNVEFKLYNTLSSAGSSQGSCSGDSACLWTETRTTTNRVRTVNGYMTVSLGSVTSFPGINWDQELWLTMNIGGTPLTPSWDGEMNPRLKLTSVPYAFRAGALVGGAGANTTTLNAGTPSGTNTIQLPAESGTICIQGSTTCGFLTGSASDYIQNSTTLQTGNFYLQSAATNSVGGIIRGAAGQTSSLLQLLDGTSGLTVAQFTNNGYLHLGSDNIARTGQIVFHDGTTSNSNTITLIAPASVASASKTITLPDETGTLCIQGSTSCGFLTGSVSDYIQNQNAAQQSSSNFWISGTGRTDVALQSPAIRPTADGATALQFQNATGTNTALSVDTTNYQVAIGNAGTAFAAQQALDVIGNIQVRDAVTATKAYRLRTSGGALDFEAGGADIVYSVWSGADFTGTQRNFLRLESGAHVAQAIGAWQFRTAASGTTRHSIDGTAGANVSFNANGEATNFTIQGDTDTNLFFVQGSTDRVGIGTNTPGYKLDVNGDINIAAASSYRIDGTAICTFAGCTPAAGSTNYIQNGIAAQIANFSVRSAATDSAGGVIQGANGQTADIFQVQTWNGSSATTVLGVSAAGLVSAYAGLTVNGALSQSLGAISLASNGAASYTSTGATIITAGDTSTWSTSSGSLTVQAATTNTLNLQTGGAGTVNLGDVNTTTVNIGRGSDTARTINIGTAGVGTAQTISIGSIGSTSSTSIQGGTGDITLTSTDLIIAKATTSLQIQNASNSPLLYADTANGRVGIGGQATFSMFEVLGGDVAIYNNGNSPRLILGNSTSAGQNGYLQWDSTNNYFRIESVGANGLKINDNYVTIGNIFPDQPLKVANGSTLLFQVSTTGSVLSHNSTNSNFGFEIRTQNATPELLRVDTSARKVAIGAYSATAADNITGQLQILPISDARVGINVKGFSPTYNASYIEAQDSSSNYIFRLQSSGNILTASGVFTSNTQSAASTNSNSSAFGSGNVAGATSTSGTTTVRSGNSTTSGDTGGVFITSGNATSGNSGSVTIDSGTASGVSGTIYVGNSNAANIVIGNAAKAQSVTVGSTNSTSVTTIQGGTGSTAINLTSGTNGGINLTASGTGRINLTAAANVIINTPTFSTATTQNCASNCTITQANVDGNGAVVINATAIGVTVTLADPTITTAGRIVYVTAAAASNDFTLSVNGGGVGNLIAMRANTSATMIWNGADWTAAGASSSTTLQAAYDNTLASAGGAEIILNNTATSNGLTIRNGSSNPIIGGGLLEVQTSIGTNLFSVNNNISELVANGGAEDSSTFSTNWQSYGTSTVTRNTTSGQYATGAAGAQFASTTANSGIRNNLATNPALNTNYMVSFTAKLASGSPAFTDLIVRYSPNGGTTLVTCIQDQTIVSTDWTRITCEVNTGATAVSNADILIYQVADPGAPTRTVYVDNLSMTLAEDAGGIPNNVQIGGGIYGGAPTLFTLDRSSAPPVENGNTTYLGSMYYDTTSGRIQCYESDGWGACGSAPDNIVTLTPEYSGAVLNGTGVGTMSADFCSNQAGVLSVNTSFCTSGISRNFYRWTSPQASTQTYSIYVSYKLPNTFKSFLDSNTVKLTALTDNMTDGEVGYEVFRSTGSAVTSCGSETIVTTPSADTWYQTSFSGDETACGFQAGDNVIFKINVRARNNASVYVENLDFVYLNF